MDDFKPGDVVTGIDGLWNGSAIISRVDSENFPDDPVAFFEAGGFWRTSQLKLAPNV